MLAIVTALVLDWLHYVQVSYAKCQRFFNLYSTSICRWLTTPHLMSLLLQLLKWPWETQAYSAALSSCFSYSLQLSWATHIPLRAMDILKVTIQHPHLSDYLPLSFSAFCSKICLYFTLNPLALLQYFGEYSCCGPSVAYKLNLWLTSFLAIVVTWLP